jgi:hypothetical protein
VLGAAWPTITGCDRGSRKADIATRVSVFREPKAGTAGFENLRVSMEQFNIVMNAHECNYRFARRPESAIYDALLF